MESKEAAALLKDPQRLRELLTAPETRRFMALLKSQNGDQLRSAAEAAKQGNSRALSEMLQKMSQSQEGAQALEGLSAKLDK
jgi:hypothetical protein